MNTLRPSATKLHQLCVVSQRKPGLPRRGRSRDERAHGGRPPTLAAVSRRRLGGIEIPGDLGEALAGVALGTDALDNLWRHRGRTAGRCWGSLRLARCSAPLGDESFELVGWDQASTPRHLDSLNVGEDSAVERGAADAERLGGLGAGVSESLDPSCLADYRGGLRVAALLLRLPLLTAPRHQYGVHER